MFNLIAIGLLVALAVLVLGLVRPRLIGLSGRASVFKFTLPVVAVLFVVGVALVPDESGSPYEIVQDTSDRDVKRSVDVILPERVDESTLVGIAGEIYDMADRDYTRTFINYRLASESSSATYWATTHFTPELTVKILGSSKGAHQELVTSDVVVKGEEIGRWMSSHGFEAKLIAFEQDGLVKIKHVYSDGSSHTDDYYRTETAKEGFVRLQSETGESHKEYFVINSNGDLEFWSENGNYYTAPAVQ